MGLLLQKFVILLLRRSVGWCMVSITLIVGSAICKAYFVPAMVIDYGEEIPEAKVIGCSLFPYRWKRSPFMVPLTK